jgi:LPXTG-motif cell wall-anchored protein
MKKVFSILLVLAMVLTLTVTALADAGGPNRGDSSSVPGKAINLDSAEIAEVTSSDGTITRNTDPAVVNELVGKMRTDELAPYVFNFTPNPGTTGEVTLENIELRHPYEFLRVWYDHSGVWTPIDGQYNPITRTVTFPLPTGFTGGPIAITVVRTTSGDVPVSPQTGEIGSGIYLLGAAVMAGACAAFVMKSRKAA